MSGVKKSVEILARMIILLFLVSIISFILIVKAPIDPLTAYVGTESTLSQAAKDEIIEHWGLDDSLPERYITWLNNILHGDFGNSITYKRPVIDVIQERFLYSAVLMALSWTLSGVLGFAAGIITGMKKGSLLDRAVKSFCLVMQSLPTFWVGLLVLSLFAVQLGWFPLGMAVPAGKLAADVTFAEYAWHLVLPVLTLSIVSIGKITLYTRQKVIEIIDSDYILFARARGESKAQLVVRHVLRNASLPALTTQFASFSELFGGMTLAETVFSYPGIGAATTAAALNGDVPLLLGITIISALFVFTGNLVANLLYAVVDPRIRKSHDYA